MTELDLQPDLPPGIDRGDAGPDHGAGQTSPKPSFRLRQLLALVGAAACAIGVVLSSPWLLGGGIAALVATSVVPDRALPFPQGLADAGGDNDVVPLVFLGGTLLIATTVVGLFRRVEAGWPLVTWLVGLAAVTGAAIYRDRSLPGRAATPGWRPSLRSFDAWMISVLTVVGFYLRVRQLETLPPMHGDEGEMSMLALRAGGSEEFLPPFTTGFLDHPTLFHYLQKLSMMLFGETVSGVRMGTAIFGALCIPAVYLVGRLGWTRRVGLVAAAVLTFSHTHIHFSRMALNNIHSVFMGIAMVACLLWANKALADRSGAATPLLATGLTCGIAQYLYYGSRLLPVVLVLPMLVLAWRYRGQFVRLLLVPFGFLLAYLPMVPRYVQAPNTFSSRQSGVGVFSNLNAQARADESTFDIVLTQAKLNLRYFIDGGDVSSFYFARSPGLNALAAILFWVGLGLALAKIRNFSNLVVVTWFVLGLVLGGILTTGAPAATRLIMIFPALALLGGIAADHFGALIASGKSKNWIGSAIVLGIAVLLGYSGVTTYFGDFADDPPRPGTTLIAREFAEQNDTADTFLMGDPALFAEHGTIRFINQPERPRNLFAADELAEQENNEPMLFVVALPQQRKQLVLLAKDVPGGEYREVLGQSGQPLYDTYLVSH